MDYLWAMLFGGEMPFLVGADIVVISLIFVSFLRLPENVIPKAAVAGVSEWALLPKQETGTIQ